MKQEDVPVFHVVNEKKKAFTLLSFLLKLFEDLGSCRSFIIKIYELIYFK